MGVCEYCIRFEYCICACLLYVFVFARVFFFLTDNVGSPTEIKLRRICIM